MWTWNFDQIVLLMKSIGNISSFAAIEMYIYQMIILHHKYLVWSVVVNWKWKVKIQIVIHIISRLRDLKYWENMQTPFTHYTYSYYVYIYIYIYIYIYTYNIIYIIYYVYKKYIWYIYKIYNIYCKFDCGFEKLLIKTTFRNV